MVKFTQDVRLMVVSAVVGVAAIMNWCFSELQNGLDDPTRRGWNAHTMTTMFILIWVIAMWVERPLSSFMGSGVGGSFRTFSPIVRKKIVVYLLELAWGSMAMVGLLYFSIRAYLARLPENCSISFVSMDHHVERSVCALYEGFPKTTSDGLMTVNPGTHVKYTTKHDTEILSVLNNDCVIQNIWGFETCYTAIMCLYIFEIIFASTSMRASLLAHHICALATVFLIVQVPPSTINIALGLPHILFACIEQPTFLALALYRLKPQSLNAHSIAFFWAWVSFGLTKLLTHIIGGYLYIRYFAEIHLAMRVAYPTLLVVILLSQIHSTRVQYLVWLKCKKKCSDRLVEAQTGGSSDKKHISIRLDGRRELDRRKTTSASARDPASPTSSEDSSPSPKSDGEAKETELASISVVRPGSPFSTDLSSTSSRDGSGSVNIV